MEAAGAEGAQAADIDDDMTLVRFSALQRMRHALRRRTLAEATFKQKPVLALPAPPPPAAGPPADQVRSLRSSQPVLRTQAVARCVC